jgi:hypothetical protein
MLISSDEMINLQKFFFNEFDAEIMMKIITSLMMNNHALITLFQTLFNCLLNLIFQFYSSYMKTILLYLSKEK